MQNSTTRHSFTTR